VFGGTSVLAAVADALGALPGTRLGLSGPKVLETAVGTATFDASDPANVQSLYGAHARITAGQVAGVADDVDAIVRWIGEGASPAPFLTATLARQHDLAEMLGVAAPAARARQLPAGWSGAHVGGGLWRVDGMRVVAPFGDAPVDAAALCALDAALLAHVGVDGQAAPARGVLVLIEDSRGHAATPSAERLFLSRYLAHHACVLGVLRQRGVRIVGVLAGVGHSAAFFANALQADELLALRGARVVAMNPDALARVTGLDAARAAEDDPLLGHPVRHFAALGGVARMLDELSPASVAKAGKSGSE
jgi:biotin-independent malonate decarboxylase gamma subunit